MVVLFFKLKKIQTSKQYIIYDMKILLVLIYISFHNLHQKLIMAWSDCWEEVEGGELKWLPEEITYLRRQWAGPRCPGTQACTLPTLVT